MLSPYNFSIFGVHEFKNNFNRSIPKIHFYMEQVANFQKLRIINFRVFTNLCTFFWGNSQRIIYFSLV